MEKQVEVTRTVPQKDPTFAITAEVAPQSITGDKVCSDKLVNLNLLVEGSGPARIK